MIFVFVGRWEKTKYVGLFTGFVQGVASSSERWRRRWQRHPNKEVGEKLPRGSLSRCCGGGGRLCCLFRCWADYVSVLQGKSHWRRKQITKTTRLLCVCLQWKEMLMKNNTWFYSCLSAALCSFCGGGLGDPTRLNTHYSSYSSSHLSNGMFCWANTPLISENWGGGVVVNLKSRRCPTHHTALYRPSSPAGRRQWQ